MTSMIGSSGSASAGTCSQGYAPDVDQRSLFRAKASVLIVEGAEVMFVRIRRLWVGPPCGGLPHHRETISSNTNVPETSLQLNRMFIPGAA